MYIGHDDITFIWNIWIWKEQQQNGEEKKASKRKIEKYFEYRRVIRVFISCPSTRNVMTAYNKKKPAKLLSSRYN